MATFTFFKIVDCVLKESGREYFPVNFQNGLIAAINRPGEVYPNQLLSIRKFDGKASVYDLAGKCPYLELNDFTIGTSTSIDNSYTGIQNQYPIDYHSSNVIVASDMEFESGTQGEFVSGTGIYLKDGFKATEGTIFTARIDDVNLSCNEPFFRNQLINETLNEEESISTGNFSHIKIFPNPSSGVINIIYSENIKKEDVKIQVIDNTGRILYSERNFTKTVDLSDCSNGIYYLTISTSAQTFHEKIIKN